MGFFGKKPEPRLAFFRELAAQVRALPGIENWAENEGERTVSYRLNGLDFTATFDNLFADTQTLGPEARAARIRTFLQNVVAPLPSRTWEDARANLRVALRAGPPMSNDIWREVLPCLREVLVIDDPRMISNATRQDLEAWSTSADGALALGRDNLAAVAGEGLRVYDEAPSRIFCVEARDSYEASRLLVPGFLAAFAGRVEGRPIAIAPERGQLYIAGDANPQTALRLCQLALHEYQASSRRISAAVYTVAGSGEVVEYVREVADDAAAAVRVARMQFHGTEYSMQHETLEKEWAAAGREEFIAPFSGLGKRGTAVDTSYCPWAHGIDARLPRTDLVAIELPPGSATPFALVAWDDVLRVAGKMLQRDPELFPPRWRTSGIWSPEQVGELHALSQLPAKSS